MNKFLLPVLIINLLFNLTSLFASESSIKTQKSIINAVLFNNITKVETLLDLGVDPNTKDSQGTSILYSAWQKQYYDIFQTLLAHGAKIETDPNEIILYPEGVNKFSLTKNAVKILITYIDPLLKIDSNQTLLEYISGSFMDIELLTLALENVDTIPSNLNISLWDLIHKSERALKLYVNKGGFISLDNVSSLEYGIDERLESYVKDNNLEMIIAIQNLIKNSPIKQDITSKMDLHFAIQSGNNELAKELIENGYPLDTLDYWNHDALYWALNSKNLEMLELIMIQHTNPNLTYFKEDELISMLTLAIDNNSSNLIQWIQTYLSRNLLSEEINSYTLHFAVQKQDINAIHRLLELGYDPNTPDMLNFTSVQWAIYTKNQELFELLLSYKADINYIPVNPVFSIMYLALSTNDISWIQWLFDHGLNLNYFENKLLSNHKIPFLYIIYYDDIFKDKLGIIELLLANGIEINSQDKDGISFLALLFENPSSINEEIIDFLMSKGAQLYQKNHIGLTSIFKLMNTYEHTKKLTMLHKCYKKYHTTTNNDDFLFEVQKGDIEKVKYLLQTNEIDINFKDPSGYNAISYAVTLQNVDLIKLLLEFGADIHQLDPTCAPLFILWCTSSSKNRAILDILIENNVDIQACAPNGMCPLDVIFDTSSYSFSTHDILCILKLMDKNSLNKSIKALYAKGKSARFIELAYNKYNYNPDSKEIYNLIIKHEPSINKHIKEASTPITSPICKDNYEPFFKTLDSFNINKFNNTSWPLWNDLQKVDSYLIDIKNGKKYTSRLINENQAGKILTATAIYKTLGLNVPNSHFYSKETTGSDNILISEVIDGKPVTEVLEKRNIFKSTPTFEELMQIKPPMSTNEDQIIHELQDIIQNHLVAQVLLGSCVFDLDNYIFTKDHTVYIREIDHVLNSDQTYPIDLWHLLDLHIGCFDKFTNNKLPELNIYSIIKYIDNITNSSDQILSVLPANQKDIIQARINHLTSISEKAKIYRNDLWKSEYASKILFFITAIRSTGISEQLPKELFQAKNEFELIDADGNAFGNLRAQTPGGDSLIKSLSDLMRVLKTDQSYVAQWMKEQGGSSWGDTSKAAKILWTHTRDYPAENYYWRDGHDSSLDAYQRMITNEEYINAILIWYAFTQEILTHVKFPFNNQTDQSVRLVRTESKEALKRGNISDYGNNYTMSRGTFESSSIFSVVSVTGAEITVQNVPHHRIASLYFPERQPGCACTPFASDDENEFLFITDGIPFDYKRLREINFNPLY